MSSLESAATAVREMVGEQEALLKRLSQLAPRSAKSKTETKNADVMTWRSAIAHLQDARELLDDLACTLEFAVVDRDEAQNTPTPDGIGATLGEPAAVASVANE